MFLLAAGTTNHVDKAGSRKRRMLAVKYRHLRVGMVMPRSDAVVANSTSSSFFRKRLQKRITVRAFEERSAGKAETITESHALCHADRRNEHERLFSGTMILHEKL